MATMQFLSAVLFLLLCREISSYEYFARSEYKDEPAAYHYSNNYGAPYGEEKDIIKIIEDDHSYNGYGSDYNMKYPEVDGNYNKYREVNTDNELFDLMPKENSARCHHHHHYYDDDDDDDYEDDYKYGKHKKYEYMPKEYIQSNKKYTNLYMDYLNKDGGSNPYASYPYDLKTLSTASYLAPPTYSLYRDAANSVSSNPTKEDLDQVVGCVHDHYHHKKHKHHKHDDDDYYRNVEFEEREVEENPKDVIVGCWHKHYKHKHHKNKKDYDDDDYYRSSDSNLNRFMRNANEDIVGCHHKYHKHHKFDDYYDDDYYGGYRSAPSNNYEMYYKPSRFERDTGLDILNVYRQALNIAGEASKSFVKTFDEGKKSIVNTADTFSSSIVRPEKRHAEERHGYSGIIKKPYLGVLKNPYGYGKDDGYGHNHDELVKKHGKCPYCEGGNKHHKEYSDGIKLSPYMSPELEHDLKMAKDKYPGVDLGPVDGSLKIDDLASLYALSNSDSKPGLSSLADMYKIPSIYGLGDKKEHGIEYVPGGSKYSHKHDSKYGIKIPDYGLDLSSVLGSKYGHQSGDYGSSGSSDYGSEKGGVGLYGGSLGKGGVGGLYGSSDYGSSGAGKGGIGLYGSPAYGIKKMYSSEHNPSYSVIGSSDAKPSTIYTSIY